MEVFRCMADCSVAPIVPCPVCETDGLWTKLVVPVHVALAGKEEHRSVFPITVPGFEKKVVVDEHNQVVRDRLGRPVVRYCDVTFKSKREQDEYMNRKGLVRTMDGRDPSIGPSQRSYYDQTQGPPPSQEAVMMAERARYVEPREVYENFKQAG